MTMSAYLLTWNPNNWRWDDLRSVIQALQSGDTTPIRWSCGNTKSIPIGARVFLLRQGVEPKGVVASGWVTRKVFEAPHYDPTRAATGGKAKFIEFSPDVILDVEVTLPLDVRGKSSPLSDVNWGTPASGISIADSAAAELSKLWEQHVDPSISLGNAARELEGTEGVKRTRLVSHLSRERALRNTKIADSIANSSDGRLRCEVPNCGFDFSAVYGVLGDGYAQVHHLRPLAENDGPTVTRLSDLVVVCANCHAIIHRDGKCHAIETLIPPSAIKQRGEITRESAKTASQLT